MTTESPLEHPAEIYDPFDSAEVKRLGEYVNDVEELVDSDFFESAGWELKLKGERDADAAEQWNVTQEWNYPGERAVREVAVIFRPLYNDHEPSSYNLVIKLLSGHVGESPRRQEALDELRTLRKWKAEVLRMAGVAFNIHGEDLTPEKLIDMWLHGRYLHKGNERSDQIDAFPFAAILQGEFMGAMERLSHVFWTGRNVVKPILTTPSLLATA